MTIGTGTRPGVRQPVPRVVTVLALSIFVLGTSEFVLTGLLSDMAADLGVTISDVGYLMSGFAVGMIVGAPLMAVVTLRLPRFTTLVVMLVAVVVLHVLGALTSSYPLLMVVRVLSAVATGGFWSVAAVVTVSSVGPADRARALSRLLAGLIVSNIAGIPLGTVVGQQFGWRATFWLIALLAVAGLIGVVALVPRSWGSGEQRRLSTELTAFRSGRLWLALATTALYQAGMIGMLVYLEPLLTRVAGLDPGWVPAVQFGSGVGALGGIVLGGRIADRYPWPTLFAALGGSAVLLASLGLTAALPGAAPVLAVGLGFVAFVAAAPLNARVFALAGSAPTLASATNTSAFNVGNSLGPALGGLAIAAGWALTTPSLLGAVLTAGALVLAGVAVLADRRTGSPW
ncbi:MFS transporter [Pseudonocardia sp. HH130630-07]|uniref:MFS transporter n=1 Tax=Pseudonocardia sp. HH130630-07 TaxID=1690815 RepID=UPI0008151C87|nr:MFS transporter [Pseudonocardia sp. HH130630-07]ANY05481.1 chemotaxis protein [Pseudonocardia sp. HH130630-07]